MTNAYIIASLFVAAKAASVPRNATTRRNNTLARRLGERTPDGAHRRDPTRGHRALERGELPTEVGDRRVRPVLDAGADQRGDQHSGPGRGDRQQDDLAH